MPEAEKTAKPSWCQWEQQPHLLTYKYNIRISEEKDTQKCITVVR